MTVPVSASPGAALRASSRPAPTPQPLRHPPRPAPAVKLYDWPFLFVLGYLLVEFGRPHNWFPPLGLMRPGMIVLVGGMLGLMARGTLPLKATLAKHLLAFWCLMLVLVPFCTNNRVAFNGTRDFGFFLFGALLPMIAHINTYERFVKAIKWWVYIHVPLGLYSITHRGMGVGSFLTDENDFALALNVILPYAFAMAFMEKKARARIMFFGVVLMLVAASTATLSRGGFIGLVCVFFMLWLKSPRKVVAAALVGVLGLAMLVVTPASYWKEMQTIETADQEGDTGAERLYLWGIGWRMFKDYPVFGVGPSNFQYNNYKYETPEAAARGYHVWGTVAHSLYFTLIPEYGIVGTTLFASMLITAWVRRRRVSRRCRDALASGTLSDEDRDRVTTLLQLSAAMDSSQLTFLVTGAFIAVLYYPHVWVLVTLTVVLENVAAKVLPAPVAPLPTVARSWSPPRALAGRTSVAGRTAT